MTSILLVNFGGPRTLDEIAPFLTSLLCDQDVIRTPLPSFAHNYLFTRIAKKRAKQIREDYEGIGGGSPIYRDTEILKEELEKKLSIPVYTFHRYLPMTHQASIEKLEGEKKLIVFPLFPQFSYATTGSIARFLLKKLSIPLYWIKSYPAHQGFVSSYQKKIKTFCKKNDLKEEESLLFFSAHGVPKKFVDEGDPYQFECELSFQRIKEAFPKAVSKLCYQSKFGKGEWLKPYTDESCEEVLSWHEGRKNIIFIPLSFTSDHIETLFEIEKLYLPVIREKGLKAYRCPALNLEPYWIDGIQDILQEQNFATTRMLVRK